VALGSVFADFMQKLPIIETKKSLIDVHTVLTPIIAKIIKNTKLIPYSSERSAIGASSTS